MHRLRSVGLITKLNLLTIGLILMTAVSIALFLLQQKRSGDHAELLEQAGYLARILAHNCEYGVYTENREALHGVMNSIAAAQEIAYVAVFNRTGRELARRQGRMSAPRFAYDALSPLKDGVRYSEPRDTATGRALLQYRRPGLRSIARHR